MPPIGCDNAVAVRLADVETDAIDDVSRGAATDALQGLAQGRLETRSDGKRPIVDLWQAWPLVQRQGFEDLLGRAAPDQVASSDSPELVPDQSDSIAGLLRQTRQGFEFDQARGKRSSVQLFIVEQEELLRWFIANFLLRKRGLCRKQLFQR
jgi:hypothetical protein